MINTTSLRATVPTAADAGLQCARLPYIRPDSASLRAVASANGATLVGTDAWQFWDGSWVALINNRIERGVGNSRFTAIPSAQTPAQPAAANWGTSSFASSSLPSYMQHPQYIGHGDLSRALREFSVQQVRQFVQQAPGSLTANARALAAQYGV